MKGPDMVKLLALTVGWLVLLTGPPPRRNDRGLSQSTENAILLTGAVLIAGIVILVVKGYVETKLAEVKP